MSLALFHYYSKMLIIKTVAVGIGLQLAIYSVSERDTSVQVCAEVTNGTIEINETFTAFIRTLPVTASAGIIMYLAALVVHDHNHICDCM